jgi:hypothetical protein
MDSILDEYNYRSSFLKVINDREADSRIKGFYDWLIETNETREIVTLLIAKANDANLIPADPRGESPRAGSPEAIAGVGLTAMQMVAAGEETFRVAEKLGISDGNQIYEWIAELFHSFIHPAIQFVERRLIAMSPRKDPPKTVSQLEAPPAITESLANFTKDHPEPSRAAFVMMKFEQTKAHDAIFDCIHSTLGKYGIKALRADSKVYNDSLFPNIQTYMHGCGFGIAVFERISGEEFNPNVSLEVGYMRGLRKQVCYLKDSSLKTLQSDLVGDLYKPFDIQDIKKSLPPELTKWLSDKGLLD